jgi:phosphoribosylformylglycinamidine cyclo-ligase
MGITYQQAGVDINAGNRTVELIREDVKKTHRSGVLTDVGSFAGLFAIDTEKYREPVLVSGTDGVGTKLKIAWQANKHDTVGIDSVAMCVNDVLVHGAEPLFFLDYIAVGRLIPEQVAEIVKGVAAGCIEAGCALIGGETAEMPGFYAPNEYDIAGFAVGVAEKSRILTGADIIADDFILGLPSNGVHSNGYSLVRKIFFEAGHFSVDDYFAELGSTLGECLLIPTRIYVKDVLPLIEKSLLKGMAHITGGGLTENIPRVLPDGLGVELNADKWDIPPVFRLIQRLGGVSFGEMNRVFNMGIGLVMITDEKRAQEVSALCPEARIIGRVVKGEGVVFIKNGKPVGAEK